MEQLSKNQLLEILGKIDLDNTKIKMDSDEELSDTPNSLEKFKNNKKSLEEINSSELTAKGKPRKRTITPKQLETFRENGNKRAELSKAKKAKEMAILEELKVEEEAKLKNKLLRRAKEKVILEMPEPKASQSLRSETSASLRESLREKSSGLTAKIPSASLREKSNNVSLQDYLRAYGL